MNDVHQIARVFRSTFPSCKDLMLCLEKNVFTDVLFAKDLTTQRANFMWVLEVIWNVVFKESPEHMEIIPSWFRLFKKGHRRKQQRVCLLYAHAAKPYLLEYVSYTGRIQSL